MPGFYPPVPGNRIGYDIDGTQVLVAGSLDPQNPVVSTELDQANITALNDDRTTPTFSQPPYGSSWYQLIFVFPDIRLLAGYWVGVGYTGLSVPVNPLLSNVEVSTSTTNGVDGAWTAITVGSDSTNTATPFYRSHIITVPRVPAKAVRMTFSTAENYDYPIGIHFYGEPQIGQILHRLGVWQAVGDNRVDGNYFDWGDTPRGSSADKTFRVKNLSSSLSAVVPMVSIDTLQSAVPPIDGMFLLTADPPGGLQSFAASLALATLAPGAFSPVLTVRRAVPSTATLGLWSARIRIMAEDWS